MKQCPRFLRRNCNNWVALVIFHKNLMWVSSLYGTLCHALMLNIPVLDTFSLGIAAIAYS